MVYRVSGADDYLIENIDNLLKKGKNIELILPNMRFFVLSNVNFTVVNNTFLEFKSKDRGYEDDDELLLIIRKDEVVGVMLHEMA